MSEATEASQDANITRLVEEAEYQFITERLDVNGPPAWRGMSLRLPYPPPLYCLYLFCYKFNCFVENIPPILDYQKKGMQFLIDIYNNKNYMSGILVDEMGLGKTRKLCNASYCISD